MDNHSKKENVIMEKLSRLITGGKVWVVLGKRKNYKRWLEEQGEQMLTQFTSLIAGDVYVKEMIKIKGCFRFYLKEFLATEENMILSFLHRNIGIRVREKYQRLLQTCERYLVENLPKKQKKIVTKCYKGTFDFKKGGICPENCEFGGWNNGICGAECLECGGDLFLNADQKVVCLDCGICGGEDTENERKRNSRI